MRHAAIHEADHSPAIRGAVRRGYIRGRGPSDDTGAVADGGNGRAEGTLGRAEDDLGLRQPSKARPTLWIVAHSGLHLCPGGTTEISRWSSEARANTTGSHGQIERTPDGVPEAAGEFLAHPPGRMFGVPLIRWCLLARLARPPANFHDASGVAKRRTESKGTRGQRAAARQGSDRRSGHAQRSARPPPDEPMPTLWNQFAWNSGAVWEPASPPLSPNQKPKPQKQTHETTGLLPQQTLSDQPNWLIAYATRLIARDAEAGLSLAIINASVADAPYLAYAIGTWLPASKARKARKARKVRTARGVSAARRLCTAPGVRVVRPTDTMLPRLLRTLALLLLASAPAPAQNPQPLLYTVPFKAKADGYPRYRIPALWHAPQKPLLAFCEGRHTAGQLTGDIDIVLKRSHDLGQTWQPLQIVADLGADTCGNPCIVQDTSNGWLWLAFTKSRGEDHEADIVAGKVPGTTVWITHSEDDGATWAAPLEISASARKATWGWYGTGPGLGLYLHSTKSDRILFPSYHTEGGVYRTHSLFSDDHGKTWQLGADAADHTSEPQVIEWDTHTLLMNARTISGHGEHRTFVVSKDRGETWKPAERIAPLVENNCQGCTYRCFRSGSSGEFDWIFTTPIRPARTGVHAWISEDAGKSWPHAQLLWSGPSAYTAMTRLQGGLVGILIECGEKATFEQIAFTKFAPEWLKASKLPK